MSDKTDALKQLLDQIKTATREAHGVLGDIRRERAETQAWLDQITVQWRAYTDKRIAEAVKMSVDNLGVSTRKAMDAATEKVFAEFDKLTGLILGRGEDEPMDVLARRVGAAVNHIRHDPHPDVIPPVLRKQAP